MSINDVQRYQRVLRAQFRCRCSVVIGATVALYTFLQAEIAETSLVSSSSSDVFRNHDLRQKQRLSRWFNTPPLEAYPSHHVDHETHECGSNYEQQLLQEPEDLYSCEEKFTALENHGSRCQQQQQLYHNYDAGGVEPTTLAQLGRNPRHLHFEMAMAMQQQLESTSTTSRALELTGRTITSTACGAIAVVLLAPLAKALSSHWPYFVAGGICASASHTAAVPLDVLKTRIQCAAPGEYRGMCDAFVKILKSEGAQVLFCGAGATLVGYAMQGFLKFGFFEFLKPLFSSLFVGGASVAGAANANPVLGSLIAASITAEIVGSSALTPLEAARIRMVAEPSYAKGLRGGMTRMITEEGLSALTRGLPAVLAKQIPYTVTKLVSFDVLRRATTSASSGVGVGVGVTTMCAVAAGMLSSLASQPGDSLLSTLNSERRSCVAGSDAQCGADEEPVAAALVRIAREAGFAGLFRGTCVRMLHVTAIVTVQLIIYQSVKAMVGIRT